MEQNKIIVGVPTYKRPDSLLRLLKSLSNQNCNFDFTVVVADNEGEFGEGIKVCKNLKDCNTNLNLRYISVSSQGLSYVRNAILKEAFITLKADFLAFIDDDEEVDSNWLNELMKMQLSTSSNIVGGRRIAKFEISKPDWLDGLDIYYQNKILNNGVVSHIECGGNCLLSKTIFNIVPNIEFDTFFNFTGGEDRDFFMKLEKSNAIFSYAENAISYEYFPENRITKKWALNRSFCIGANEFRILKKNNISSGKWIHEISKAFIALFYYVLKYLFFIYSEKARLKCTLKLKRQLGKLSVFMNKGPEPYGYTSVKK